MAIMNNKGDSGLPCLRPLACEILRLGLPFMRILDDEVPSIAEIQFRHFVLKPRMVNTSSKYGHSMESNALEIPNYSSC